MFCICPWTTSSQYTSQYTSQYLTEEGLGLRLGYFKSITEAITLPSAACYILIILLFSGVYVSGIWGERKEANVFGSFFYSQWISLAFWCTLCLILIIFCLLSSVVSRVMICCPWDSTRMDHLFSSVGIKAWLYIYYGLSSRMVRKRKLQTFMSLLSKKMNMC